MKSNKALLLGILLYAALSLIGINTIAQTLTISGKVNFNSKIKFKPAIVAIVDMDSTVRPVVIKVNRLTRRFTYTLKDKKEYLIIVSADNYTPKAVAIMTNYSSEERFMYKFRVNLHDNEPIVLGPLTAGRIFYNEDQKEYDYYLANDVKH